MLFLETFWQVVLAAEVGLVGCTSADRMETLDRAVAIHYIAWPDYGGGRVRRSKAAEARAARAKAEAAATHTATLGAVQLKATSE